MAELCEAGEAVGNLHDLKYCTTTILHNTVGTVNELYDYPSYSSEWDAVIHIYTFR